MRLRVTLSILILFFLSCSKKDSGSCPVICGVEAGRVYFSGFSNNEIDTIYVLTFSRNGHFDTLIQRQVFFDTASFNLNGAQNFSSEVILPANHDYEIIIPADTITYKISLANEPDTMSFPCDRSRSCSTPFQGASISGGKGYCSALSIDNGIIVLQK